jgi:hypothetical protein
VARRSHEPSPATERAHTLGRRARIAISIFVVVHIGAVLWWNIGVIDYAVRPRPDDAWHKVRSVIATVDPSGLMRSGLEEYMRFTALWQVWMMFGPDAPHETGLTEVRGIERYAPDGSPVYDEQPLKSVHDVDVHDYSQRIGLHPCSWMTDDSDPRWVNVRRAYAHWYVEEAERERGKRYAGVELICFIRALPKPGAEQLEAEPWEHLMLWQGRIDRDWRSR